MDVGQALSRNIAKGELVEAELDRLVERRSRQKDPDEVDALWLASVMRHEERRQREADEARYAFHAGQAGRLRRAMEALVAGHLAEAARYAHKLGIDHDTKEQAA